MKHENRNENTSSSSSLFPLLFTQRIGINQTNDSTINLSILTNGTNKTNDSTNRERPCSTTRRIRKEHSICQFSVCLDLVIFPVLRQIEPQAPLLVVPFRQFLRVSTQRPYSSHNTENFDFSQSAEKSHKADDTQNQLRTARHHNTLNQERAVDLSTLSVSGPVCNR